MSLVLAGQVAAASWSAPAPIAPGAIFAGVIGLDFYSLLAIYNDQSSVVYAKRSNDRGKTWEAPVQIATDAFAGGAAREGSNIHVVFHRGDNLGGYGEITEVWYTRSTDGGASFSNPVRIAGPDEDVNSGGLLTGPGGLVMIVWSKDIWNSSFDDFYTVVRTKVSTNGGVTFGPARKVLELHGGGGSSLVLADGVLYRAYQVHGTQLRMAHSFDLGAHWSASTFISDDTLEGEFSLTTEGSTAVLAYVHRDYSQDHWGAVRYRRSTDNGVTWSSPRSLTAHKTVTGRAPGMLLRDGVLHAFYRRGPEAVYQRSLDGVSWTPYEPVASLAWPGGIVIAGRVIVTFETEGSAGFTNYLSRRLP